MSEERTTMLTAVEQEERAFALAQRKASTYMFSTVVPEIYRVPSGTPVDSPLYKEKMGNCLIAFNIADRMSLDPLEVMQNLYIVHGNPAFKSSFLIGRINISKRFSPLHYECKGEAGKDDYGYRAYAYEKEGINKGKPLYGDWITWAMVRGEGWDKKPGSKWKTMPDQMFRYRAAAFWQRVYCPEISMGVMMGEEAEDVEYVHYTEVKEEDIAKAKTAVDKVALAMEQSAKVDMETGELFPEV